jgi:hypothetical protein
VADAGITAVSLRAKRPNRRSDTKAAVPVKAAKAAVTSPIVAASPATNVARKTAAAEAPARKAVAATNAAVGESSMATAKATVATAAVAATAVTGGHCASGQRYGADHDGDSDCNQLLLRHGLSPIRSDSNSWAG